MKQEKRVRMLVRMGAAAVFCVLALGGCALVAAAADRTQDGVLPGVTLMGEPVGGMTEDGVRAAACAWADARLAEKTLTLHSGGEMFAVRPEDAGLVCDTEGAVREAVSYGREGSLFRRLVCRVRAGTAGYDVKLRFSHDDGRLTAFARRVADTLEIPYVPSSWSMTDDTVTIDVGHVGRSVNADALADALSARFSGSDFSPLWFPVTVRLPLVTDLAAVEACADVPAVNAAFDRSDPLRRTISDEAEGRDFDREAAEKTLAGETGGGEYGSVYTFPRTAVEPEVTRASLEAMLFRDVLAERTTRLNPANTNRTTNVRLACGLVDGTVLGAGETFSYNGTVGERTYARGFRDATVFRGGEKVEDAGGGICQVSSTLYMAAARADLEIVERACHRFAVGYAPLGEDATVYYGSVDFRFRNSTDFPLRVECVQKGSSVTVRLVGTDEHPERLTELETVVLSVTEPEDVETVDASLGETYCERTAAGQRGYATVTYRVTRENGREIARTVENRSYYQKEDRVWTVGKAGNSRKTAAFHGTAPREDGEKPGWLG